MNHTFDAYQFAAAIRTRRREHGLREAAAESGVSASALQRIEHGETPTMETFLRLCEWLDQPIGAFLQEEGKPPIH